ncbi:MAG: hypothetical protein Q7U82_12910 [Gammaproteobacteria bacterium]|nr:hypothetical protein [Gammaproteobacteria bacterium]
MQPLNKYESVLLEMAGELLLASIQISELSSYPEDTQAAWSNHDQSKLYPRITITSPHGGGAMRIEATLCDPITDEAVVRLVCLEAIAEATH